jgi:hypothetical protein
LGHNPYGFAPDLAQIEVDAHSHGLPNLGCSRSNHYACRPRVYVGALSLYMGRGVLLEFPSPSISASSHTAATTAKKLRSRHWQAEGRNPVLIIRDRGRGHITTRIRIPAPSFLRKAASLPHPCCFRLPDRQLIGARRLLMWPILRHLWQWVATKQPWMV